MMGTNIEPNLDSFQSYLSIILKYIFIELDVFVMRYFVAFSFETRVKHYDKTECANC